MAREVKVALGVTGCIAAYKAVQVLRGLQKRGATVHVVMTANACQFVTPLTFQAISGLPAVTAMFAPTDDPEIKHIAIAGGIDLLLVAPATANMLAKFAHGISDDFLSTLYISTTVPVLVAPAMNVEMWRHPATQANIQILRDRGVEFVDPGEGYLACRSVGPGRLAEPEDIVTRAWSLINRSNPVGESVGSCSLAGYNVLVTAGPTYEAIDPVRGITNRSSGRMGFALAESARNAGAEVTLISGPVSIQPAAGIRTIHVRSAAEMHAAVMQHMESASIIVMAAAVADYRPAQTAEQKIKKNSDKLVLELERTEDILAGVCRRKGDRIVVGFAAETEDVIANARKKLVQKQADIIVANDVSRPDAGFDVETNQVTLVTQDSADTLPLMTKLDAAGQILELARRLRHSVPV
ncbi:MAG TPA: bifunctional phosphopantothenoylcysteine decarboxylase/phosphopantothenate--cysteine ligase CoaBC [Blastocatellia bacterium]